MAIADVNGDGRLDLVSGNGTDGIDYFQSAGPGNPVQVTQSINTGDVTSVALGDIDGDGDPDLVTGNNLQPTRVYRNDDGAFEETPVWESLDINRTQSVTTGDLDGDGYLEVICGNAGDRSTLYRNDAGVLTRDPTWESLPGYPTYATALGDLDRDGDLDLVCGNSFGQATAYINEDGMLNAAPTWVSGLNMYTRSIALGDLDGDGDLDLVCGNSGQSSMAFRNDDGSLTPDPVWSSIRADQTVSVALGDVDGDGDLDVICGNVAQPTTVYANRNGALDRTPDWTSGRFEDTRSIVVADLNSDGTLDLIVGNHCEPMSIFGNAGIAYFQNTPSWRDGFAENISGSALGDLDGDGDLDLVCAYSAPRNEAAIFRNDDAGFTTMPVASLEPGHAVSVLALGDLDQDGDLDLVCGGTDPPGHTEVTAYVNSGGTFSARGSVEPTPSLTGLALGDLDGDGDLDLVCGLEHFNYAYRNVGGTFEQTTMWQGFTQTDGANVALGDLDGDGDLDLVCGPSSVFLNASGTFPVFPHLLSGSNDRTTSIALGDMNGDGDLDLVCGNNNQPIKIYENVNGVLSDSSSWQSLLSDATNSVALGDLDGDGDLDLVSGNDAQPSAVYRNDSGTLTRSPIWGFDAREYTNRQLLGDIDRDGDLDLVSANGDGGFVYLGSRCPAFRGDPRNPTHHLPNNPAFLRSVDIDHTGRNAYRISFQAIDVESDPIRLVAGWQSSETPGYHPIGTPPQVSASPGGDLHMFDWDVSLVPADTKDMTLRIQAVSNSHTGGPVQYTPMYVFRPPALDVRAPRMRVPKSLRIPATTVGDTSVVNLKVINAGTETLTLSSVQFESTDFWTTTPFPIVLEPLTDRDIPVSFLPHSAGGSPLPGDYVRGTSKLIVAGNDPTTAADTVSLETLVRPFEFITNDSYLGGFIPQGLPLGVGVFTNTPADSAIVLYRHSVLPGFSSRQKLTPRDVLTFTGNIPADSIGIRSIEYTVQVFKGSLVFDGPTRFLRVRTTDVSFPDQPAGKYRLISLPLEMEGTIVGSLVDDLEGPNPASWRLFTYDAAESSYHEIPDDRYLRWELGRGYWMITRESVSLDTGPEEGLSLPDSWFAVELFLEPGWNLIGNPYPFPIPWDPTGLLGGDSSLVEPPVRWGGAGYDPDPVSELQPFEGYWVANRDTAAVQLFLLGLDAGVSEPPLLSTRQADTGWHVQILASSGSARDDANFFGERAGASEGWDRSDRSEPPPAPGPAISVYFPHWNWMHRAGLYTRDFRPPAGDLEFATSWEFDVVAQGFPAGQIDPVVLDFQGIQNVPAQDVYLLDRVLDRGMDLRMTPRYTFFPDHGKTAGKQPRFELRVGARGLPPESTSPPAMTRLWPNRPNPFRSNTVFRYDIAELGQVTLRIYDLTGRSVRTLERQERRPGRYEIPWSGEDDRHQALPPGVYFARLTVGLASQTLKLLRIE